MLTPNFPVTSTAKLVISGRCSTQKIAFTNNNVGSGSVYFNLVDHGFASTLTTANGNLIPTQPNPYIVTLTPGYAPGPYNLTSDAISDDSDGFDVYVISNSTAQVSVQTFPF